MFDLKEQIYKVIESTPFGEKIKAEREAGELALRRELIERKKKLLGELEEGAPPLRRATAQALEAIRKTQAALKKDEGVWVDKKRAERSFIASKEMQIVGIDAQLCAGASPLVGTFLDELRAMADTTRRIHPEVQDIIKYRGLEPVVTGHRTNIDTIEARLADIRAALTAAEALKVLAIEDVPAELEKIKREIREVEPLKRSTSEPAAAMLELGARP